MAACKMIDIIALVLGHALLAAALLRLALRMDVDDDPFMGRLAAEVGAERARKRQQRRGNSAPGNDSAGA